ncbi:MAG: hypothetical protein HQK49_22090 [Oligoflexia bacterium]|nr:hypothetical protein [Oligoflexia bacterium]
MNKILSFFVLVFYMLIFVSVNATYASVNLPTQWSKFLHTDKNDSSCKIKGTIYLLKNSPFAYLVVNTKEKIPMWNYKSEKIAPECLINHYKSILLDNESSSVSYELTTTCEIMSSLPKLTIKYNGTESKCDMTWIGL